MIFLKVLLSFGTTSPTHVVLWETVCKVQPLTIFRMERDILRTKMIFRTLIIEFQMCSVVLMLDARRGWVVVILPAELGIVKLGQHL